MKKNILPLLISFIFLLSCNDCDESVEEIDLIYKSENRVDEEYSWNLKKIDDNFFSATLFVSTGKDTRLIAEKNVHGRIGQVKDIGSSWSRDTLTFITPFPFDIKYFKTLRGTIVTSRAL